MQHLISRILRIMTSSSSFSSTTLLSHASSACVFLKHVFSALSLQENLQKLQDIALSGGFVKWGSLGFYRTSMFATGFTPLQPKPLDSIMNVERMKDRSPEDITSISGILSFLCGEEVVIRQCSHKMPHIIFIGLEDYEARGTQAVPYFSVSYLKEFAKSKGLVLIRGD